MPKLIYLLLKQHNVTKKQYLCKKTTSNIAEVFKYKGSGVLWNRHLKKHGCDISTVILEVAKTNEELKEKAKFYNELWSIGKSTEFFLNLKPEERDGGGDSGFYNTLKGKRLRKKMSKIQLEHYQSEKGKERKRKQSESGKRYRLSPEGKKQKVESSKKQSANLKQFYKTNKGKKHIRNHKKKLKEFYQSEEGKTLLLEKGKQFSKTMSEFYSTEAGDKLREKLSRIHKEYYQSEEGKKVIKERSKKASKSLKEFYQSESGIECKKDKSKKLKEFFNTEDGKRVAFERNKNRKKPCKIIINNRDTRDYVSVKDCLNDLKIQKEVLKKIKCGEIYTIKERNKNTKHEFEVGTELKLEWI